MKKQLFITLMIMLPLLFAGCEKEDKTQETFPPQYIDFVIINSWIGTSEADVANELLQLGFEKEEGYDNYTYLSMDPYYFVSCWLSPTDEIIQSAGTSYTINVDSYSTTLEAFKNRVMQERQLFKDNRPENASGHIRWSDRDDDETHTESYNSFEALVSAAAGMNSKNYVELLWDDFYSDMEALTVTEFFGGSLQRISMNLYSH